jgi:hypothetical protein
MVFSFPTIATRIDYILLVRFLLVATRKDIGTRVKTGSLAVRYRGQDYGLASLARQIRSSQVPKESPNGSGHMNSGLPRTAIGNVLIPSALCRKYMKDCTFTAAAGRLARQASRISTFATFAGERTGLVTKLCGLFRVSS